MIQLIFVALGCLGIGFAIGTWFMAIGYRAMIDRGELVVVPNARRTGDKEQAG